jgi:hypothetical protein
MRLAQHPAAIGPEGMKGEGEHHVIPRYSPGQLDGMSGAV